MPMQLLIKTNTLGAKTYSYSIGHAHDTTMTFRQHKAQSHCRFLHTYPMKITAMFDAPVASPVLSSLEYLDGKNLLVLSKNDPQYETIYNTFVYQAGLTLEESGCEKLAEHFYGRISERLIELYHGDTEKPKLLYVEVAEKPGNYAGYSGAHYFSGKRFGPEAGFTTTFMDETPNGLIELTGGLLTFDFRFRAAELDHTNFVVDFGSLKGLKGTLENFFDHTLWVNQKKDTLVPTGQSLSDMGIAQVQWGFGPTHMEYLREEMVGLAEMWLTDNGYSPRVVVDSVITDLAFRTTANGGM